MRLLQEFFETETFDFEPEMRRFQDLTGCNAVDSVASTVSVTA